MPASQSVITSNGILYTMNLWIFIFYLQTMETLKVPGVNEKLLPNDFNAGSSTRMKFILDSCFLPRALDNEKYVMLFGDSWTNDEVSQFSASLSSLLVFDKPGSRLMFGTARHRRVINIVKINSTVMERKLQPAGLVIVEEASEFDLMTFLESLRGSIYWTNEAAFLVVSRRPEASCSSASSMLALAWSYDISSIVYLCRRSDERQVLYSLNPFAPKATSFWRIVEDELNSTWTLFSRDITDLSVADESCYYDRLADLTSYKMSLGTEVADRDYCESVPVTEIRDLTQRPAQLIDKYVRHIGASYDLKFYTGTPPLDADGRPQGILEDLIAGKIDLCTRPVVSDDHWKMQTGFSSGTYIWAMSRKRRVGNMDKFLAALDPRMFFEVALSCVMFLLVARLLLGLSWSSAGIEFVRVFTSSMDARAFARARYGSERVLLCTAILLIAQSSAYFIGLFHAVNAIDNFYSPVDRLDDFINDDRYEVRTHTTIVTQIEQMNSRKIVPINDVPPCLREILARDNVICICGEILLKAHGVRDTETIHVSKPLMQMRSVVYPTRPDWFLLPKLNGFLLRIYETGFVKKQYEANYTMSLGEDGREFGLNIEEMRLVFSVGLAGYALAIVTFVCEVINEKAARIYNV